MSRRPEGPAPVQIPLRLPLAERARFDTFEAGDNGELIERLRALGAAGEGFDGCYLHGAAGTGRSHLLQATCQQRGSGGAMYLPLSDPQVVPAMLDGLESRGLVALDDLESWLGRPDAEAALLDLYQGLLSAGGQLLMSARRAAVDLDFHYPDLASRVRALPAYRLRPLDDAQKAALLVGLAARRGLSLPAPVVEFWLSRGARDLPGLLADLERLDEASLAQQRRITVPLVKQVLGL